MLIIIKSNNNDNTQEVLNVMPHNEIKIAEAWMGSYMTKEMQSLSYAPVTKNTKYVSYMITEQLVNDSLEMTLMKRYKRIHTGYIYNSGEWIEESLFTLQYLLFTPKNEQSKTKEWQELNTDINKSVLSQLDRDNLHYVLNQLDHNIKSMTPEISIHFTDMLAQILRNNYKELYRTVIRRFKKGASAK